MEIPGNKQVGEDGFLMHSLRTPFPTGKPESPDLHYLCTFLTVYCAGKQD